MKPPLIPLLRLAGLLILAGCATVSASPPPESSPDFSIVRPEVKKITPDDPLLIFQKVFPKDGRVIKRDALETSAEYAARLASLGVAGTYVFQIPPELCHVFPYPDENVYIIASNDRFMDMTPLGRPTRYGITLAEIDASYDSTSLTKHGVPYDSRVTLAIDYKLWLQNFSQLPAGLRWNKDGKEGAGGFGLRVQTAAPGFRQLLREKKIGLAVRVRIGDLSQAFNGDRHDRQIFHFPAKSYAYYVLSYLPVTLLEAWVVDTSTQMSVVHWTASPNDPK